jgi:hypothetical protein
MSTSSSYIRLPSSLTERVLTLSAPPLDTDEFAARQVAFIEQAFGHCAYLSGRGRDMPISDAFLSVFVNLLETLQANAPVAARHCAAQLQGLLSIVVAGFVSDPEARSAADPEAGLPSRIDGREPESP